MFNMILFSPGGCNLPFFSILQEAVDELFQHISASYLEAIGCFALKHVLFTKRGAKNYLFNVEHDLIFT